MGYPTLPYTGYAAPYTDHRLHILHLGDIGLHEGGLCTVVANSLGNVLAALVVPVRQDEVRALSSKEKRRRLSDSRCSARHDRYFACQLIHKVHLR